MGNNIKFKDLYAVLDRRCLLKCFMEFDNSVVFATDGYSLSEKNLKKVENMIVKQVCNDNGDEWEVYLAEDKIETSI